MNRPPELARYLSTNDAFPPTGLPTLERYLARLKEQMGNLDSDISSLRAMLTAKEAEKSQLQQEYTACKTIQSPIRQFPPEILGLIFAFTVGTAPFNRYIDVAHLRGVCASWRRTALATPVPQVLWFHRLLRLPIRSSFALHSPS
ncbi:hypothetical protein BKA70DRAFT_1471226 [Coprinopsis sp. MPI-PUGE-AT-0042]|nr:hypothetical protein BKA70DRAFT_1471226 [Coprinopsis sp. MPI-PUGE-AT-0042]